MKTDVFKVVTVTEFDRSEIESLIVSAIEGGSNYWYRIESKTNGDYLKTIFKDGLVISDFMANDAIEREGTLNTDSIIKGLALLQSHYPHHFAAISDGNADASTGDVFLQLALFGDVIYG